MPSYHSETKKYIVDPDNIALIVTLMRERYLHNETHYCKIRFPKNAVVEDRISDQGFTLKLLYTRISI